MGYSHTMSGKLCCDGCHKAGREHGVRKRKCAFGWCQSPAFCSSCYLEKKARFRAHCEEFCKPAMAACAARQAHEKALLEAGAAVRCSALGLSDGRVHVIFRKLDRTEVGYYMASATYAAANLLDPTTPEMFAEHGALEPAPTKFSFGKSTKETTC